jgi:hypothetical protein
MSDRRTTYMLVIERSFGFNLSNDWVLDWLRSFHHHLDSTSVWVIDSDSVTQNKLIC